MAKEIKTKSTFGTLSINHFSPALSDAVPKGINIHLSFEDALKLQLGLNQILLKLNTYNRNTKDGKEACVNLCVFRDLHSLTINEGQLGKRKEPKASPETPDLEALLAKYIEEVEGTNLEPNTKNTYLLHARNFVRWTKGDFVPGKQKG